MAPFSVCRQVGVDGTFQLHLSVRGTPLGRVGGGITVNLCDGNCLLHGVYAVWVGGTF